MLKPYIRQQIQTNKILDSINNTYYRDTLEQILTHEDTLYNIICNTRCYISLSDIITNTDSVVIVVKDREPHIIDKNGGDTLGYAIEDEFVGTECYTIYSDTEYIIETNYRSRWDAYKRIIRGNKHA